MLLGLKTVKVKENTREALLAALAELGEMDADFSGENGIEYLWKEASDFDSNCEYCIDKVKNLKTDEEIIEKFVSLWIDADGYYKEHELNVIYDKKGKAEYIALAVVS